MSNSGGLPGKAGGSPTYVSRVLAQVEIAWSNSMIEAWWRSLKHGWLFLNQLDTLAAVERLVAFYVQQHNEVMPHAALGGRTPNEVFRGEAADLQERVRVAHRAAVQERITANQRLACGECPVPHAPTEGNTTSGEQYRKDE
jgi:putative transposase